MVVFGPDRVLTEVLYAGGLFDEVNGVVRDNFYTTIMNGDIYNKNFSYFDKEVYSIAPYYNSGGTYQIIVGGKFNNFHSQSYKKLIKLDGTTADIDTTFDTITNYPDATVRAIAVEDDTVFIGGDFTAYQGIPMGYFTKISAENASLDYNFNLVCSGFDATVRAIVVQPDGKIIVGGDFTQFTDSITGVTSMRGIIRLNSDGSYDSTFNNGNGGFDLGVNTIALQPDGNILVGGTFTTYSDSAGTNTANYICRLSGDGSFDTTFNPGAGGAAGTDGQVNSIALDRFNRPLVGGGFTTYTDANSANTANYIVRLDTDGVYDATFDTTKGFDSDVYSITNSFDEIFVGGRFSTYNTVTCGEVTRLYYDGTRDSRYAANNYNNTVGTTFVYAVLYRRTYL